MDPSDPRQLETIDDDGYWETFHRRNNPESAWYDTFDEVPEDLGINEDSGDDVARRERLAQAMYEI